MILKFLLRKKKILAAAEEAQRGRKRGFWVGEALELSCWTPEMLFSFLLALCPNHMGNFLLTLKCFLFPKTFLCPTLQQWTECTPRWATAIARYREGKWVLWVFLAFTSSGDLRSQLQCHIRSSQPAAQHECHCWCSRCKEAPPGTERIQGWIPEVKIPFGWQEWSSQFHRTLSLHLWWKPPGQA